MGMTRDDIEDAARQIAGPAAGWRQRAASRLGVSGKTLQNALNEGRWSADFEAKILSALVKSDVRASVEIPVADGIEADLQRLAGGDSRGWQERAAEAAGVSVSTIRSALEGRMSDKTRQAIEAALARVGSGAGRLDRQAGEWAVASPETRSRSRSVIGEAIVTHLTDPVVIVHVTQRYGKSGFGDGAAPIYDKRIRFIDEPATRERGQQIVEQALTRAYEHIRLTSAQRQLSALSNDAAAAAAQDFGITLEEARESSYQEIVKQGRRIRALDVRDELTTRILSDIARLRDVIAEKSSTGDIDAAVAAAEEVGGLMMMQKYIARAFDDGEIYGPMTPSADMMHDAIDGGLIACVPTPLADKRGVRGRESEKQDAAAEAQAEARAAQASRKEVFDDALEKFMAGADLDDDEMTRRSIVVLRAVLNADIDLTSEQIVEMLRQA